MKKILYLSLALVAVESQATQNPAQLPAVISIPCPVVAPPVTPAVKQEEPLAYIGEQLRKLNEAWEHNNVIAAKIEQAIQEVSKEFARENALLEKMNELNQKQLQLRMGMSKAS